MNPLDALPRAVQDAIGLERCPACDEVVHPSPLLVACHRHGRAEYYKAINPRYPQPDEGAWRGWRHWHHDLQIGHYIDQCPKDGCDEW